MEALTPLQRIAVIAVGLVITIAVAALIVPWIIDQFNQQLQSIDSTPVPSPSPISTNTPAAGASLTHTTALLDRPGLPTR